MSRIGKRVLSVKDNIEVVLNDNVITVKGPKGELSQEIPEGITVVIKDNEITVERKNDEKKYKQLHGTINALISNMLTGVEEGFEKGLEIIGVGYRFQLNGKKLIVNAGYSNPKEVEIPEGITVEAKGTTEISIKGIDKRQVGEFAANVRKIRKPEPYKGKGIRYAGKHISLKVGKKAS